MSISLIVFISSGAIFFLFFFVRFIEIRKGMFILPKKLRFRFDRCIVKSCLEIFKIVDRIQKVIIKELLLLPRRSIFLIVFILNWIVKFFQKIHKHFSEK